ncbi:MAG: hypothetical protein AAB268_10290 [Elusimicrobiota bacterium]
MGHLTLALIVLVAGSSSVYADPAKTAPFSTKTWGEGAYKHPDAEVGQYFETKPPNPDGQKSRRPRVPARVSPKIQPVVADASRPRPRPFVEGGALDSASEDARRDYEARLLGAESAPRRPGLADPKMLPPRDPAQSASTGVGMMFVSLELDHQEAGVLRDAVAGLGATAAFRPDARFQPIPGEDGSVRISGWLPASRLGDLVSRPGVKRIEVERGFRPAADNSVVGDYLLKLRLSDVAHPEESIAQSVRVMTAETSFKLDRVFGFMIVPGGDATALVSGTMPISRLSRALGLPEVIEITAAPPPAAPAKKDGFLKFVMARGRWLVLLSVLLVFLAVFVPYR